MSFTGAEGSPIVPSTAADWTKNYRENVQPNQRLLGHFFGKEILNQILAQDGCQGIRFYYAIDDNREQALIAVGANSDEDDQLGTTDIVADMSCPSPPSSGVTNILNS